jgi:hypothetical protein
MGSLREIGYDLPSAIADIVDNSIAAAAKHVEITFAFDGADSWIRIADDGVGMTGLTLEEAMRYGTQRAYEPGELGRFGLGLKTASLSQCRLLTVASRRGLERRRIEIRRWDLDHVARTNRWEVLRLDAAHALRDLVQPLLEHPGTVILWEGLDRVFEYRLPGGAAARHGFAGLASDVSAHLAMVFHRFLGGEASKARRIVIKVNGVRIAPWDPYALSEPNTLELTPQLIPLTLGGGAARVRVRPYVLPPQERFSSASAHAAAAGPQRWNRQQGFYFYRNDRLIQAGGWNRLRTLDEHTKLARIAVDLPPGSDEVFGVNVAKMRVSIPPSIRDPLMAIASGVATKASERYRSRSQRPIRRPGAVAQALVEPEPMVATLRPTERDLLSIIVDIARDEFREEPDIVRRLVSRIQRLPAAASDAVDLVGIHMVEKPVRVTRSGT